MTTNLYEIIGSNEYCFPAIMAGVTGKTTDECEFILQKIMGTSRKIKGVVFDVGLEAFRKMRYETVKLDVFIGYTLYSFCHTRINDPGIYLISVGGHVILIEILKDQKIALLDNHTVKPINVSQSARLMQKITNVAKITPKNPPKFLRNEIRCSRRGSSFSLGKTSIYEDPSDNTITTYGHLTLRSKEEIEDVIRMLKQELEDESRG